MAAMSRNNSVGALQGFSICQPFLGASLQFYPALGTQQLDDLINAYFPGPASIKEKRATVSMDFFEYSQLTGETFKYYPVVTQAVSAESSPVQDSGYDSNFVSPVISDWNWSHSTPSTVSVSTPTSVAQEMKPTKITKKSASAAAKSQANDFSHLPGMKIMTKDGRDVTNSASRGCKTKEQRDHAHLMRIIKACDACKKKKVRCDPSHKKRTAAAQAQPATPARLPKKARTSTAPGTRTVKDRQSQHNISPSLFTEPILPALEVADTSFDFSESWESFVQYDDEAVNVTPFDYDFFFDPAGHLSPQSSRSPATPSAIFDQLQANRDILQTVSVADSFENAALRPPTLPYLDASGPANNYVDFSLYSPEPSFLDDDSALVNEIGASNFGQASSLRPSLTQDRRSNLGASSTIRPDASRSRSAQSPLVTYGSHDGALSHQSASDVTTRLTSSARAALANGSNTSLATANGGSFNASPVRAVPSQVPLSTVASSDRFSTLVEEQSYYATITATISGESVGDTTTTPVRGARVASTSSAISRGTSAPLSSRSSLTKVTGVQSAIEAMVGDHVVITCRALVDQLSMTQALLSAVLIVAVFGKIGTSLEARALVGGLAQILFGLVMYEAYYPYSSLHGLRPQQSRLSTTPKPQGFSDSARLLSCVSTRLRHTRRQNAAANSRASPAVGPRLLGFARVL
ncbi:hypothetical protein K4K49_011450 [Colletotrichum sp. SAR 10_70]|nr:hypothetical protein K4K49_011450 [Colletotrichum sp. SAR 10_70]KAI8154018.1 hypothetical protein K4K50_007806 [Colletotrichum sp. SAR 10_71]KAI8177442.1 hypothetical protein K4K51_005487 [Colletotrichum sp. SAR 10_75]KAI8231080.1 hypothetical protein K4K54_000298 [Colletotrichum sp. SAR 10_86]KAJ4995372.1 hypothetical protein K4K48_010450 [Colletotrichum sp. SAR 10_66]